MVHPSLVLTASVCWLCSGAGTVTAIKAHPEPCTGRSLSACGPTNTLVPGRLVSSHEETVG